jgi:uncharacterized protein YjbJ (UPF0337 family)
MNNDIAEGKWKQLKGQIQQRWGDLTDDDLDRIAGRREEFVGIMQEKYGKGRDQAEREFDEFNAKAH